MSNFGANNRFLQSNLTTNDLATETTLKDIDQILKSGTISVGVTGTSDINLFEILGVTTSVGSGVLDFGCQRIVIATDNILTVKTGVDAFNTTSDILLDGTVPSVNNGSGDLGTLRVAIANDSVVISNLTQIDTTAISTMNGVADAGTQKVVIASDNDPININIETLGVDSGGTAISVNNGTVDNGTQRVVLATDSTTESILQSNLGINTSAVNNFNLRGFSNDIPDVSMTELSDGFVNAGEMLTLPTYSGIVGFDIVSTSALDTNTAGTGARSVHVVFSDETGLEDFVNVNLNGTTPVVVGSLDIVRFVRAQVQTTGSGNANAGRITIYVTSGSSTTDVYEQINVGNNLSASSRIFIPEGKTVIPTHINLNMFSASSQDLFICIQIKAADLGIWYIFQTFALNGTNEGFIQLPTQSFEITTAVISGGLSTAGLDIRFLGMKSGVGGEARCSINMNGYFK